MQTKRPERQYLKLTENNEWEGETWHFFVPVQGNEEATKLLKQLVMSYGGEEFELDDKLYSESEVDTLVRNTDSGYMDHYNKLSGTIKLGALRGIKADEDFTEKFYKGGIRDICHEN
jgi:hypothetical protein